MNIKTKKAYGWGNLYGYHSYQGLARKMENAAGGCREGGNVSQYFPDSYITRVGVAGQEDNDEWCDVCARPLRA